MNRIHTLFLSFLILVALLILPVVTYGQIYPMKGEGFSLPEIIPDSATGYPDLDLFYSQLAKNKYEIINSRKREQLATVPLDTFLARYVERGMEVNCDTASLFDFFNFEHSIYSVEESELFIEHVSDEARKYNNLRLNLAIDFIRGHLISAAYYDDKVEKFEEVIRTCRRIGDNDMEASTLENIWKESYFSHRYARSFTFAQRLEEVLGKVSHNYPYTGVYYIEIGMAYYAFKDYDRSISLLRKGLSYRDSSNIIFTDAYLKAWNHLASYHAKNGDIDSAAYYHRTILASPQALTGIPAHSAIAISNLGKIEMQKGNYEAAIAMLQAGLGYMENYHRDMPFITGLYTSLSECYLALGDLATAKEYIDKGRKEAEQFPEIERLKRLKELYARESSYQSGLGQQKLSRLYFDSTLIASTRYEQLTGQHIILLGQQQLQEAELQLKSQQVARQKNILVFVLVVLAVITGAMIITIRLYRRRNAAYKALAQKAKEWAQHKETAMPATIPEANGKNGKEPAMEEDKQIMARIEYEMNEKFAYRAPDLNAESLAGRLGIHRNALSRAVNRTTDGNFSQYINTLRIKEAIRIISGTKHNELYIDELYEQVGFSNRSSFYRVFKQFTGLSPIEFQKNALSKTENN